MTSFYSLNLLGISVLLHCIYCYFITKAWSLVGKTLSGINFPWQPVINDTGELTLTL